MESQSYGASPAIWDHTVLPATRHRWACRALTPAMQAGTRFTYPGGMEGWVYRVSYNQPYMFCVTAVPCKNLIMTWVMVVVRLWKKTFQFSHAGEWNYATAWLEEMCKMSLFANGRIPDQSHVTSQVSRTTFQKEKRKQNYRKQNELRRIISHWVTYLPYLTLPYLTFGVGRLLHLPSTEAISVRPNAQPRYNHKVTVIGCEAEKSPATWNWWCVVWLFLSRGLLLVSSSPSDLKSSGSSVHKLHHHDKVADHGGVVTYFYYDNYHGKKFDWCLL